MYLLMKRDVAAWFKRDIRTLNDAQKARIENTGVLTASGLIAGEALCGLVVAGFRAAEKNLESQTHKVAHILPDWTWAGTNWLALVVLVALAVLMIRLPLKNAGRPDEPAPPTAIM
jgi:phage terminase large subunit-like protein